MPQWAYLRQRSERFWGAGLLIFAAAAQGTPTAAPTDNLHSVATCHSGSTCWCPLIPQEFLRDPDNENVTDMLAGHTLKVVAFHEPPFAMINNSAPPGMGWGKRFSGFEIELTRRLAERGGFQVEYHEAGLLEGETWTESLVRVADHYDLVAGGGWLESSERRQRGVTFTTAFADFGTVLVAPKPRVTEPTHWDNAFFWTKPFTWEAYLAILGCITFASFCIWCLERPRQPGKAGCAESLYMGWLGTLGFGDHTWVKNWFSRGINVFWTLLIVVVLSSYTASLTNFLVQSSRTQPVAQDVDDFLHRGYKACIPKGWALERLVALKYSGSLGQISAYHESELTKKVADGVCDGLLMPLDYARSMVNGGPPRIDPVNGSGPDYGCSLQIVGRSVIPGPGAFPAGSGNCRWFVTQVFSGLLRKAAEQQEVAELFADTLKRITTHGNGRPRCPSGMDDVSGASETMRISHTHIAGLLVIICALILIIAIVGIVVNHVCTVIYGNADWAVDLRTLDDGQQMKLLTGIRDQLVNVELMGKSVQNILARAPTSPQGQQQHRRMEAVLLELRDQLQRHQQQGQQHLQEQQLLQQLLREQQWQLDECRRMKVQLLEQAERGWIAARSEAAQLDECRRMEVQLREVCHQLEQAERWIAARSEAAQAPRPGSRHVDARGPGPALEPSQSSGPRSEAQLAGSEQPVSPGRMQYSSEGSGGGGDASP
eukprot:TRINITY_DN7894_c0_g1_i1.p1 TRINITY_DN7894_c0_g1~~TRINITY_DN7894_c0_g1_i1.p1  ORF type:complete len:714 (+),score=119.05 TRINITY_DN7894_c0_g1_i1:75-2216(+)